MDSISKKVWGVFNDLGTLHSIPLNDLLEHELSTLCPCRPLYDGNRRWIHNSADGRELSEEHEDV